MDGHPDHRLQFVAAITYPRAVRYCGARPLAMKVTLPAFDCVTTARPSVPESQPIRGHALAGDDTTQEGPVCHALYHFAG